MNIAKAITSVYKMSNHHALHILLENLIMYIKSSSYRYVLGFAKTNMNGSIVECKWIWRATTSYTSHGTP